MLFRSVKFIVHALHYFLVSLKNIVGSDFFSYTIFSLLFYRFKGQDFQKDLSGTYTPDTCALDECAEACHMEEFTERQCEIYVKKRIFCFCMKGC